MSHDQYNRMNLELAQERRGLRFTVHIVYEYIHVAAVATMPTDSPRSLRLINIFIPESMIQVSLFTIARSICDEFNSLRPHPNSGS